MKAHSKLIVHAVLVPALFFACGPWAWAQSVGEDRNGQVVPRSESDDDGYEDEMLIGLFVVVVAVLVVLGIRSDYGPWAEKEKPVEYAHHDPDEDSALAPIYADYADEEDSDRAWHLTGLGLRAEF